MLNVKSLVLLAISAMVLLAVGVSPALAKPDTGYGPGAMYQVELSANIPGTTGGGVWLWLALYPNETTPSGVTATNGTVDYAGSDCPHNQPGAGASKDLGDATWQYVNNGTQIEIDGVVLSGLPTDPVNGDFSPYITTITIPADYGHYNGTAQQYMTLPYWLGLASDAGFTQLQVAP